MKKLCLILAILVCHSGNSLLQADIIWVGGAATDDFYDDANWDFTGSASATMASPTDDIASISGATINEPSGAFTNIEIGDGLSVSLDSTSFTFTNNNGFTGEDDASDVASLVNLNNASFLNLQFISIGTVVNVDGTSHLQVRGGGDGINSQTETSQVFLAQGGMLTMTSVAEFGEQGNEIFASNSSGLVVSYNSDNSILSFSGTEATAVFAAVPEPSSVLVLGLIGIVAGFARRRN